MISIQKLFGKDDTFFNLLDASASEGRASIQALNSVLSNPAQATSIESFHKIKVSDKRITDQINELLVTSFVTELEREDIEVLSHALYRIPKSVEKIVQRFTISHSFLQGRDFGPYIKLLGAATEQVVALVFMLRKLGAGKIGKAKELNGVLQKIEGDADALQLEMLRDLYSGAHEPIRVLALRDVYELLEEVVDYCRDAGTIVTPIVLKNS